MAKKKAAGKKANPFAKKGAAKGKAKAKSGAKKANPFAKKK